MSLSSFELPAVLLAINRSSILAVGLPILLGFGSGFITRSSIPTWYRPLIKPPGEPPRLTFPIAWTLLYASMGLASHFLVKAYDNASPGSGKPAMNALELYWIQYALNLAWTPLFFGANLVGLALCDILVMTPLVYALTYCANKVDPRTTYLLAPYCAWLTYASYLNAGIWWLN